MEKELEKMSLADLNALDRQLMGRSESHMTKPMFRLILDVRAEISKRINALLKRLEYESEHEAKYEAEGKKLVDRLLEANKAGQPVAAVTINSVITEFLTEKEIRDTLIKLVNRNKLARSTVAFTLTEGTLI